MTALVLAAMLTGAGEASISHVPSAEIPAKGLVRLGIDGSVSTSTTFPEPGVSHRLTATALRLAYVPFETMEVFASLGGSTLTAPQVLSAQGDALLGLKWKPGGKDAFWAFDAVLRLPSGVDGGFPVTNATSLMLRALAGADLGSFGGLSLRLDGALGMDNDRSRNLVGDLPLTPVERYGLGIQPGKSIVGGLALSARQGAWMPFAELSTEIPLATPTAEAPRLSAKRVTAGFRWEFVKGATLDASADVALGKTAANALFRTAPPLEMRAGVSIAFDPLKGLGEPAPPPAPEVRTIYVEKPAPPPQVVEVPAAPQDGMLAGRLVAPDGKGIADAVVDTSAGRTVTDADGRFELRVLAGRVGIAVKHPDFEAATLTKEVTAGVRTAFELHLSPRFPTGTVLARIVHPEGRVNVRASGPSRTSASIDGADLSLSLAPGKWTIVFSGDGLLAKARTLEVEARRMLPVEVTLAPKPPVSALDLSHGLATVQPLTFEGEALSAAAAPVLDEIADFLLDARTDVKLSVGGIAPAGLKGAKADAAALARAEAVRAALVARGIAVERLETKAVAAPKKAKPAPSVLFELVP